MDSSGLKKSSHFYSKQYGVIVIGGGHAGCEAALASSRMGIDTLLLTMNIDSIALMSCNPSIGGVAKGQIVREIDALGGEMAKCIDATGIQFRVLNTKKGTAVQSYRAQADRSLYRLEMTKTLERQKQLDIKQAVATDIYLEQGVAAGVFTDHGMIYKGKAIVFTPGTFLNGLIHIGENKFSAGRAGEFAALDITSFFTRCGFKIGRLKTGTPPRLYSKSIDFSDMVVHDGDAVPKPFSYSTKEICREQRPCYVTYTNKETRKVIEDNLHRSPLYSGVIQGVGPRYCPSIEDKIKRFPEKERHHVFLEPEGYANEEIYPNGVSTSLPVDVQIKFLRTIKGLENVEIMRPGYAIEYDFVLPIQLKATLETKLIPNLYHGGQVNGTSGYEEAAAQGLLAGINAALKVKGKEPLVLGRDEAYIGVLIDDLTTKGTEEPYRMFTSRAEHRLLLRTDNADLRLSEAGNRIGLLRPENFIKFQKKKAAVENEIKRLKSTLFKPQDSNVTLLKSKISSDDFVEGMHLIDLLKRPEIKYKELPESQQAVLPEDVSEQVEIQVKYEGYINRQYLEIERIKKLESKIIPRSIDYDNVCSLSNEIREKLKNVMPETLGQASRIPGVTPAAIITLLVHFKKSKEEKG